MKPRLTIIVALALGAAAPAPENITDVDPNAPAALAPVPSAISIRIPSDVAELIRTQGYQARVLDAAFLPYISGENGKYNWLILFFNCQTDTNECSALQYYFVLNVKNVNRIRINEWNRTHRFGRAYLNEDGYPVVEMDVNLTGLSKDGFLENMEIWFGIIDAYNLFLQSNPE